MTHFYWDHVRILKLTILLGGMSLAAVHAQTFSESALIGKWQGPRYQLNFHTGHTFDQNGWTDPRCTWRVEGTRLIYNYPDLGNEIPPWYPEPGETVEKIISVDADKLVTENGKGFRLIRYRIKGTSVNERESAASRAKAEQLVVNKSAANSVARDEGGSSIPAVIEGQGLQTTPLGEQAIAEARRCFAAHFIRRGDSWIQYENGSTVWMEHQKPSFTLTPSDSAADRLNGYEYRAKVNVSFVAQRIALFHQWEKWQNGGELKFEIVKKQGVWKCLELGISRGDPKDLERVEEIP